MSNIELKWALKLKNKNIPFFYLLILPHLLKIQILFPCCQCIWISKIRSLLSSRHLRYEVLRTDQSRISHQYLLIIQYGLSVYRRLMGLVPCLPWDEQCRQVLVDGSRTRLSDSKEPYDIFFSFGKSILNSTYRVWLNNVDVLHILEVFFKLSCSLVI